MISQIDLHVAVTPVQKFNNVKILFRSFYARSDHNRKEESTKTVKLPYFNPKIDKVDCNMHKGAPNPGFNLRVYLSLRYPKFNSPGLKLSKSVI